MYKFIRGPSPEAPAAKHPLFSTSPSIALVVIALSIFVFESLVMLFFSRVHDRSWRHWVCDASLVMALVSPVLYCFAVRPLAFQIKERKLAENALRQSEARFRMMFERHDAVMLLIDAASGDIVDGNAAASRFYGYRHDVLCGMRIFDINQLPRQEIAAEMDAAFRENRNHFVFSHRLARGEVRTVEVHSTPVETGGRKLLFSIIHDITERKQFEERLLATARERERLIEELRGLVNVVSNSQKQWQDTFDGITDMISIHDTDYTVVKANKAFAAFLGRELRDVVGRKCYELFHHGSPEPVAMCPHRRTIEEKRPMTEELFDTQRKKTLRVSTYPYLSTSGTVFGTIHVVKDITKEKEKEMQLILSERLALLGQTASGIAHEINNPLEAILIGAEALLMRVEQERYDPAVFLKYLRIIDEETVRCRKITSTMLSYARQTSFEKTLVDPAAAIDKALDLLGVQGRLRNVSVNRNYGPSVPAVPGNEGELRQVFLAILLNALDAMNDRGAITIALTADDRNLFISIHDTGPGISPEMQHRIFAPFFTTKGVRGGTGLGLSIAQKIAANHGGAVDVASEAHSGSVFTVRLPR
jgi:two-component system cell cycle sensor histidine kinase/response regulator CckA